MMKIATTPLTDEKVVEGIQTNNVLMIDRFIREYSPKVSQFLISRGAKEKDVEDIVMVSLTAAYQNIRKEGFILKSALSTYLFQIAKFQFFKLIDRNKLKVDSLPTDREFVDEKDLEKDLEEAESINLLWEKFHLLGKKCQEVLSLWLDKTSMSEIAKRLDIPSEGAARAKKFQCLNNLKKAVWGDVRFAEIYG